MNSREILYNVVGTDESYTPEYGVQPILKYIPEGAKVWCPFDLPHSNYVKLIKENGNEVIHSHYNPESGVGSSFFDWEPEEWDIIISNPPFQKKRQFFERALSFGKPFALLMTCAWLNDKFSKWVFYESEGGRDMQLLMFDKRIHFEQNGETRKATTFSSAYFCSDILPRDIVLEKLGGAV